jgi:hypothetical protein
VHTFPKRWDWNDPLPYPVTEADTFRCAEDVVAKASVWPLYGRQTVPEVWHLDPEGHHLCGWRASSLCSLIRWADEPFWLNQHLLHTRADGCTCSRWAIVDSRPTELPIRDPVSEADARAFTALRKRLAEDDVDLVDAVVFDDQQHWWSMRELTLGTTSWVDGSAPLSARHGPRREA